MKIPLTFLGIASLLLAACNRISSLSLLPEGLRDILVFGDAASEKSTFDKYQKPMTEPSRGIYRAYTHTEGCFVPPANEKQGAAPMNITARQTPGPEVLDQIKRPSTSRSRQAAGR